MGFVFRRDPLKKPMATRLKSDEPHLPHWPIPSALPERVDRLNWTGAIAVIALMVVISMVW
jgi:hypothetical protein